MNCLTKSVSSRVGFLYRFEAIGGVSLFHSSTPCRVGSDWRKANGLPIQPNREGPLAANHPDYTYLDGRPTPAGGNVVRKALKHKELTAKIIKFTSEIDFAVEHHQRQIEVREQERQYILGRKLKAKGQPRTRN